MGGRAGRIGDQHGAGRCSEEDLEERGGITDGADPAEPDCGAPGGE